MAELIHCLPCTNPHGEMHVYPVDDGGGSWAVDHSSRSGDSNARIGTYLALHEAIRAAKRYAQATGADFIEGVTL